MFFALRSDFEVIKSAKQQGSEQPSAESPSTNYERPGTRGFFDVTLADIATLILAGSTVGLWIATRKLWQSSDRTAQRQLRAYVHVRTVRMLEINSGFNPNIWIVIKNFGQTPAREMQWNNIKPHLLETTNFYIFGRINYRDIFAEPHSSEYRFRLVIDSRGIRDKMRLAKEGRAGNANT